MEWFDSYSLCLFCYIRLQNSFKRKVVYKKNEIKKIFLNNEKKPDCSRSNLIEQIFKSQ